MIISQHAKSAVPSTLGYIGAATGLFFTQARYWSAQAGSVYREKGGGGRATRPAAAAVLPPQEGPPRARPLHRLDISFSIHLLALLTGFHSLAAHA